MTPVAELLGITAAPPDYPRGAVVVWDSDPLGENELPLGSHFFGTRKERHVEQKLNLERF